MRGRAEAPATQTLKGTPMSGGESGQYPGYPAVGERSGLNLDGTPCRPAVCSVHTAPQGS
jgi:hypothetical protein